MSYLLRKQLMLDWIEVYPSKIVIGKNLSFNKTSIPTKQIANVTTSTNANGNSKINVFNLKSFKWVLIETTGGKTHKIKLKWGDGEEVADKILELL